MICHLPILGLAGDMEEFFLNSLIFYLNIFNVIYFNHILSLSLGYSRFSLSLPWQPHVLIFSLTNKRQNKTKNSKKANWRIKTETNKTKKKNQHGVLCWLITPGPGGCPRVWFIYPVTLYWRKLEF